MFKIIFWTPSFYLLHEYWIIGYTVLIVEQQYPALTSLAILVIQQQYNSHLHSYQNHTPTMYNYVQLLSAQNNNMYLRCSSTTIVISTHLA